MPFGLGLPELIVILVILFFLFGAKRIPEMASGIGQGIKSFKKALSEDPEQQKSDNVKRIEGTSKPIEPS